MKRVLTAILITLFLISFALASQGNGQGVQAGASAQNQEKIKEGNYEDERGNKFQIQERDQERTRIKAGNFSADCDCNITQEKSQNKTKLKTQLSNGRNAEIKVMPDTASEGALERLRLKNCIEEQGCTIELKEIGKGNETELAYELKTQRQSRVFGIIKTPMQVQAQVNAESGEIIRIKKPWWAFIASEPEEE